MPWSAVPASGGGQAQRGHSSLPASAFPKAGRGLSQANPGAGVGAASGPGPRGVASKLQLGTEVTVRVPLSWRSWSFATCAGSCHHPGCRLTHQSLRLRKGGCGPSIGCVLSLHFIWTPSIPRGAHPCPSPTSPWIWRGAGRTLVCCRIKETLDVKHLLRPVSRGGVPPFFIDIIPTPKNSPFESMHTVHLF